MKTEKISEYLRKELRKDNTAAQTDSNQVKKDVEEDKITTLVLFAEASSSWRRNPPVSPQCPVFLIFSCGCLKITAVGPCNDVTFLQVVHQRLCLPSVQRMLCYSTVCLLLNQTTGRETPPLVFLSTSLKMSPLRRSCR